MTNRVSDVLVARLSEWLAGHASVYDLRGSLETADRSQLSPEAREAVDDLLEDLHRYPSVSVAQIEVAVREALEALASG